MGQEEGEEEDWLMGGSWKGCVVMGLDGWRYRINNGWELSWKRDDSVLLSYHNDAFLWRYNVYWNGDNNTNSDQSTLHCLEPDLPLSSALTLAL